MLEDQIKRLADAVEKLTAALTPQLPSSDKAEDKDKVTEAPASKPAKATKAKPAPEPAPAEAKPATPPAEAPKPAAAAEADPNKVTLAMLRDAAQKALDAGKLSEVVAINKEYNLRRISEAPEDKYAEILARLQKVTNG